MSTVNMGFHDISISPYQLCTSHSTLKCTYVAEQRHPDKESVTALTKVNTQGCNSNHAPTDGGEGGGGGGGRGEN